MTTYHSTPNDITERPENANLGPFAWCLFFHARCYIGRNLTDGHIPAAMLARISPVRDYETAVAELVAAGLWTDTETGYHDTEYLTLNRTRAQVEAGRADAAERKRRSRAGVTANVTPPSHRDNDVTHTPSDPDPDTEPSSSSEVTHADLDERERQRFDQVLDAVVAHLETIAQPDHPDRWRKKVRGQRLGQHADEIATLIRRTNDTAPAGLLAARVLGEPATTLNHHLRSDADAA